MDVRALLEVLIAVVMAALVTVSVHDSSGVVLQRWRRRRRERARQNQTAFGGLRRTFPPGSLRRGRGRCPALPWRCCQPIRVEPPYGAPGGP